MENTRNLCEEIEISLYSDTELTDEQKKHIESCEACRQLLSQIKEMKKDLGVLSVPGIKEGQVADSVMQKVREEKAKSKPLSFPKFKFVNHLGTIAAVAVIVVAALIIKNPSDEQENISVKGISEEESVSDSAAQTDETPKFFSAPAVDSAEELPEVDDEAADSAAKSLGASEYNSPSLDGTNDSFEDKVTLNIARNEYGGSGGGSSYYSVDQESEYASEDEVKMESYNGFIFIDHTIFEGIEFCESLEENVILANSLIEEYHYGDKYKSFFNLDVLIENGYDNKTFVEGLQNNSAELFSLYSGN